MSDYEIKTAIARKEKEISFFRKLQANKILIPLLIICIVGQLIPIAIEIFKWTDSSDPLRFFLAPLVFFAVFVVICLTIVLIYCSVRKKNAPENIAKLQSQIEELKSQLGSDNGTADTTPKNSTHEIDLLLKYKELLDKKVITQEEFEAKKRELLDIK